MIQPFYIFKVAMEYYNDNKFEFASNMYKQTLYLENYEELYVKKQNVKKQRNN